MSRTVVGCTRSSGLYSPIEGGTPLRRRERWRQSWVSLGPEPKPGRAGHKARAAGVEDAPSQGAPGRAKLSHFELFSGIRFR